MVSLPNTRLSSKVSFCGIYPASIKLIKVNDSIFRDIHHCEKFGVDRSGADLSGESDSPEMDEEIHIRALDQEEK